MDFIKKFQNSTQNAKDELVKSAGRIVDTEDVKKLLGHSIKKKILIIHDRFDLVLVQEELRKNIIYDRVISKENISQIFDSIHRNLGDTLNSVDSIIITYDSMPIATFINKSSIPKKDTVIESLNKDKNQFMVTNKIDDKHPFIQSFDNIIKNDQLQDISILRMDNCSYVININHRFNDTISFFNYLVIGGLTIAGFWLFNNYNKPKNNSDK